MGFTVREVKTEKLLVTITVEMERSLLTPQEATDRIQNAMNGYSCKWFSEFIVGIMRETSSSGWDLKKMEIIDAKNL